MKEDIIEKLKEQFMSSFMNNENEDTLINKIADIIDDEVERRIAELMPTEEEIIEAALRQTTHKSLLPAHRGLMKDYFIIGAKWFRNRMSSSEKPNNSDKSPEKFTSHRWDGEKYIEFKTADKLMAYLEKKKK